MTPSAPLRALLAAALLLLPRLAAAEVEVPRLTARVTDLAAVLTPDQRAGLEASLAAFEARKGSQVAILIVPTTQPETAEQYATRVFEAWKLGRKGVDDGILLIVARNDRRLRIEVGRGLEGAVPDVVAKRIVSDVIAPRFREGDFYGGISQGVDRLLRVIDGEPLPPPAPGATTGAGPATLDWIVPALIVVLVVSSILRALFGRFFGSGLVGVGAGMLGYLFVGLAAGLAVGVIAFVVSLLGGVAPGRRGGWSSGRGWGSTGGFGSGGGFGGFSGGGGGSAGGGASGSW